MRKTTIIATACLLATAAQAHGGPNRLPSGVRGPISVTSYDGITDDLLTAGLGKTGLMGGTPAYANPFAPTAAELRRNAIYVNYRALVDYTAAGGMGRLYGPNIDANGNDTGGEGKIAGTEFIAWADDGSGSDNVTLMVQVPKNFDPAQPCIVSATSSGSRGVYGAIGTAGEWGLKRGCAVAYADKGSGNGLHDLMSNTVQKRDGTEADAATVGTEAVFKAAITEAERAAFNAATPNRVAFKHAHSQRNPEKDWGRHTLQAIRYAFYELNNLYGKPGPGGKTWPTITPENTLVIASSVSNGGGAALAAAEEDREGLIDGVAVSEPNAQPRNLQRIRILQGASEVETIGKPLADYFTFANVYQPCAMLSSQAGLSVSPLFWPAAFTAFAQLRCASLAGKGLVQGATTAAQADDALAKMRSYGWGADSNFLHQSHYRFATNAIAVTYTNSYGRFGVQDNLCGFSFANTSATGAPVAQNPVLRAQIFANGNGVPPASGVNIVYNPSAFGPALDFVAVSPSTGQFDFALDGALCQRALVTGTDPVTGAALTGEALARSERVREGIAEVQLKGKLRGKPTLIVAGRNDALLPVNHTARAYFAKTQQVREANVRYVEVTNAQHFDSFIAFGPLLGFDSRYIPLHVYFNRAMDAMWAHLKTGAPLPASQVVRTVPRGAGAPALTAANVPPIAAVPAVANAIAYDGGTLAIPD